MPDALVQRGKSGPVKLMRQHKHTRSRPKQKRKTKQSQKRLWTWKEVIGLASLVWSVFRFVWEQVHGSR
jgi:hypothetical protein